MLNLGVWSSRQGLSSNHTWQLDQHDMVGKIKERIRSVYLIPPYQIDMK